MFGAAPRPQCDGALAAGTGKLTRALAARFAHVIAVEPDDEMRAHISGEVLRGTAEKIPLADGSVDAVFVGDAFHWFDTRVALAEIRRVTRPGGGLALLFNRWFEQEQPPMPQAARAILDELYRRFHPAGLNTAWLETLEAELGPLPHETFVAEHRYSGRDLAELLLTASSPAALSPEERARRWRHASSRSSRPSTSSPCRPSSSGRGCPETASGVAALQT